jgi:hypothetical protein
MGRVGAKKSQKSSQKPVDKPCEADFFIIFKGSRGI